MASSELASGSPAETEAIAARVAERLRPGDVVTLSGEIGTGKTTFVRGAARALGVEQAVTSPTFAIGHRYTGVVDVSHLDLYRFTAMSRAEWGDLESYFDDAIVFVEWPDAGIAMLPPARLRVTLSHVSPEVRSLRLDADEDALLQGFERADPGLRHGD